MLDVARVLPQVKESAICIACQQAVGRDRGHVHETMVVVCRSGQIRPTPNSGKRLGESSQTLVDTHPRLPVKGSTRLPLIEPMSRCELLNEE